MITIAKKPVRRPTAATWAAFLQMLPAITRHAHVAFRNRKGDDRDDMIQEVVANAPSPSCDSFSLVSSNSPIHPFWPATASPRSSRAAEWATDCGLPMCSAPTASGRRASSSSGWISPMRMTVRGSKQP